MTHISQHASDPPHQCACGKPPTRQLHSNPIDVSVSGQTRKTNPIIRGCHPYARKYDNVRKSAIAVVLRNMQVTLHDAARRTSQGASRSVHGMSA